MKNQIIQFKIQFWSRETNYIIIVFLVKHSNNLCFIQTFEKYVCIFWGGFFGGGGYSSIVNQKCVIFSRQLIYWQIFGILSPVWSVFLAPILFLH